MKLAILGFGKEGRSVYKYLRRNKKLRGADVFILDRDTGIKLPRGVRGITGEEHLGALGRENFDIVFRSPGIPYLDKNIQAAHKKGAAISSATILFFEEAERIGARIIGVSGSKGKTTACHLIYGILKQGGKRVFLAGNVGISSLDILLKLKRGDWVVLELSSFQLQDLRTSPAHAVLLDVFPEHLDAHASLKEYYSAKSNLVRHQGKSGMVVYADKNPATAKIARLSKGRLVSLKKEAEDKIRDSLVIPGAHTLRNATAAATLARELGISWKDILKAISRFKGVEHRLELVRTINIQGRRVDFYNDSAATNPETTIAAISSFPQTELILLAGGYDKGLSYASWAKHLQEGKVSKVILYGANLAKIYSALKKVRSKTVLTPNLVTATALAFGWARLSKQKHVAILLSPGAASFDQFRNYAERGKVFKYLVKKLRA